MNVNLNKVPAYYINLDRAKERREHMEKFLKRYFKKHFRVSAFDRNNVKLNPKNEIKWGQFKLAYQHAVAVATSHVRALQSIKKTPAVIVEDDIVAVDYQSSIEIPNDADIVYLGFIEMQLVDKTGQNFYGGYKDWGTEWSKIDKTIGSNDCYRLYGALGCHAILYVTDRGVEEATRVFSKSVDTGIPIDVLAAELMQNVNVYVTKQVMFAQGGQENTMNHPEYFFPSDLVPPPTVTVA